MRYVHVRLEDGPTGQLGYIEEFDYFLSAPTRPLLEQKVYSVVEATQGMRSFGIIWKE